MSPTCIYSKLPLSLAVLSSLIGSGCDTGTTAGDDPALRGEIVDFEFTDQIYGMVESNQGKIHGQIISSEDGDVVAEASWDTETYERTLWTIYQPEPMTESVAPLEGVDNDNFLVNDLAVIVTMTDDDPSNDTLKLDDGDPGYRANHHGPKGGLDSAWLSRKSNTQSWIRVRGWTCDPDRYSSALNVHIYAQRWIATWNHGRPDSYWGPVEYKGSIPANRQREAAVGNQCGGYRYRGFDGRSSAGVSTYAYGHVGGRARVAAININSNGAVSGSNPVLSPGWDWL